MKKFFSSIYRLATKSLSFSRPRALILLYHRIVDARSDPQLLCVSYQHFSEHLEVLRKHWYPLHLKKLIQAIRVGSLSQNISVVTFDDGYADNFYNAKDLLDRYDVPGTIFVASGYVGIEREFWWDELERLLLQTLFLPETLRLNINGKIYQWELGESASSRTQDLRQFQLWNILEKENPTPRHGLYRSLYELLRPLPEAKQRKIIDQLRGWAGPESKGCQTDRSLSPGEILALAEGGLVEVGAHTVTHPVLSQLPLVTQRAEVQGSKADLEEILGRSVNSFSYPYGAKSDYTTETVAAVREAGFTSACSNFANVVWPRSDPFQLPRFLVRNWDGEEFARRLNEWFLG